jgi:hypothetical protein
MLLEAVAEWRAGMPPAPFLPGGFELLREESDGRPAFVFVRCTRMSGGEAESQEFGIIHRAEVCAESFEVEGARLKHRVLLAERLKGRIARVGVLGGLVGRDGVWGVPFSHPIRYPQIDSNFLEVESPTEMTSGF